ncbi:MAG: IS200/IS605 family transposase [Kiritimatiellae bacterium]|nr:IS200/IS605 family transposase [Kiritimatiellia bacterium]
MAWVHANILIHAVFSTRRMRPWVGADVRARLYPCVRRIVEARYGRLVRMGGTEDHLHLLVDMRPASLVTRMLRKVKEGSARWIRELFPELRDFDWQQGSGVFSVGRAQQGFVSAYIGSEQQRHRHLSFREEFLLLLDKYGIPYDEHAVWR